MLRTYFSKLNLIMLLVIGAFVLNACATLSKEECLAADWRVIGQNDGTNGFAPQERFAGHVKACSKIGVTPDQTLWNQGYQSGLVRYCTPTNGLNVGEAGKPYANVCPLDKSPKFIQAYNLGKKVHDIRASIASRKSSISSRQSQIDEKVRSGVTLTPAEQVAFKYEVAELSRKNLDDQVEISRLSGQLALAETDVQDYRLKLTTY
tara:strand:+ start:3017 stop:3634 length:618 start_codon:yes stop_codon:yes gene_type:complete